MPHWRLARAWWITFHIAREEACLKQVLSRSLRIVGARLVRCTRENALSRVAREKRSARIFARLNSLKDCPDKISASQSNAPSAVIQSSKQHRKRKLRICESRPTFCSCCCCCWRHSAPALPTGTTDKPDTLTHLTSALPPRRQSRKLKQTDTLTLTHSLTPTHSLSL